MEESIKREVLQTLPDRASRFVQVRKPSYVPEGPFAAPSVECAELFRNGHYFGCIALTQLVLGALIQHVWQREFKKKPNEEGSFCKNVEALHKKKLISDDWKTQLDQLPADRQSFHQLHPSVKSEQQKLEDTARNTLRLLNGLEGKFFDRPPASRILVDQP